MIYTAVFIEICYRSIHSIEGKYDVMRDSILFLGSGKLESKLRQKYAKSSLDDLAY